MADGGRWTAKVCIPPQTINEKANGCIRGHYIMDNWHGPIKNYQSIKKSVYGNRYEDTPLHEWNSFVPETGCTCMWGSY